jgi:hypothetical protein
MLEQVQTFFGKIRGMRGDRQTIINQTMMWHCTQCDAYFKTKEEGEQHKCHDQKANSPTQAG